ncbi:protealysin inhibitor emfourin [Agromyces sp. LHK192]|uniref:protealysin inhibitor emfourin n=1 Tax=Agromyces sp. LHK192 TaxID=2498704 RepID=UPI000FDC7A86|nr:protealysin inhibitor emfourin [Agromyces sp. LHK192]
MDVIVSRSGGFAGLLLVWEIDLDQQPDRESWEVLIHDIPWDDVPPAPAEPDRFTYRIRCTPHEATLAERQVTGPWRELVDRVRDATEPRRAAPGSPRA